MHYSLVIVAGIVTGICSGLLGIGGGIVLVPILIFIYGFSQHTANGTSLVALLLPVGALGVFEYYKAGKIGAEHIKFGLLVAVGIFLGTFVGSKLAVGIPENILRKVFATALAALSLKLFIS